MEIIGSKINDRYMVLRKLAEGGMSKVYLANDVVKDINVALKILKEASTSDKIEDIIRFRNEATLISKINVKSVGKIYEVGETCGIHYFIMEYLNGKTLHELLKNNKLLSIDDSIEIIIKI
jgi:serine/threonine-protein kinase